MAYPAMDNWWSMLQVPIKDDKSIPAEVILPEDEDSSKELQQEEPMKKNILQYITIEKK